MTDRRENGLKRNLVQFFLKARSRNLSDVDAMERRYQKLRIVRLATDGAYCGCYRHSYCPLTMRHFHKKMHSLILTTSDKMSFISPGLSKSSVIRENLTEFLTTFHFRTDCKRHSRFSEGEGTLQRRKAWCKGRRQTLSLVLEKLFSEWRNS